MSFDKYPAALKYNYILNGRYIIQDVLGQGGFGITYSALDYQGLKEVAIKEYFPTVYAYRDNDFSVKSNNPDTTESFEYGKKKFLEEAQTLAGLNDNPAVVRVYSYFEDELTSTAYFVMEYIHGISLKDHLKDKEHPISWKEAWKLLEPVARVLSEVHKKDIIHRDIKPANIMLANTGNVVLIDFGAAKVLYGRMSQSLQTVLTPGYAPVEQYLHGSQGPWTDIYALGATLYNAITGQVPPDSMDRWNKDSLVPPSRLGAAITSREEEVLMRALAVRQEDRFQTMDDFINAVKAASQRSTEKPEFSGRPEPPVSQKSPAAPGFAVSQESHATPGSAASQKSNAAPGSAASQKSHATPGSAASQKSNAAPGSPAFQESPAAPGSPAFQESPAAPGSPAFQESPAAPGSPVSQKSPAAPGSAVPQKSPAAPGSAASQESPAALGSPVSQKSPAAPGSPASQESPAAPKFPVSPKSPVKRKGIIAAAIAAVLITVIAISLIFSRNKPEPEIEIVTRGYDEPDPDEKASAHNWYCSDVVSDGTYFEDVKLEDDFHANINASWLTSAKIPSGHFKYDMYDIRQKEVNEEILNILESKVNYSSDPYISHCQELVQDFYKMWLDWDTRNTLGVEPLENLVSPLKSVKTLDELTAVLTDPVTVNRANCLVDTQMSPDMDDSTVNAVFVNPQSLIFGDSSIYADMAEDNWKNEAFYTDNAGYVLERLGYTEEEKNTILQNCFAFEKEMASCLMTAEELSSEQQFSLIHNPVTLKELKEKQGAFPLTDILSAMGLDQSRHIILMQPEWLTSLAGIYDEAHVEKIRDFLLVTDCLKYIELLDRACYDQSRQVQITIGNAEGVIADKEAACEAVSTYLGPELGCVYADLCITKKTREDIRAMTKEIVDSFRQMLQNADFLSEDTRKRAISKLDKITFNIASPEDYTALSKERSIEFDGPDNSGTLADACAASLDASAQQKQYNVNKKTDSRTWTANAHGVGLVYAFDLNSVTICAGTLGDPLYNDSMPREEKLGKLGVDIATFVAHAYGTLGMQYNENGNYRNWWTQEDYDLYHTRTQKVVDYFSGFSLNEQSPVKGALIVNEAVGLLAGTKCILQIAEQEEGFDYEVFFHSIADRNKMLTTDRTELFWNDMGYFLPYLKTNAILAQFEEFHHTFGIKEGDGMYLDPKYRLEVW